MGIIGDRLGQPLLSRVRGPGGLYNLGNIIGFSGGLIAAIIGSPQSNLDVRSAASVAAAYIAGSPSAAALTIATAIFFWSGEEYHRAWANGFPPDERRTQTGDLLSAVGAMILAIGLYLIGDPLLAATAGLLHSTGKLGSALNLKSSLLVLGLNLKVSAVCRVIVIISRVPAIGIASIGILANTSSSDTTQGLLLAGSLLVSCTVWAAADIMLFVESSILKPKRVLSVVS